MPSKNAFATKGTRIADSGSFEAGAGVGDFLPTGLYSGYLYRGLLGGFGINAAFWAGVTQLVSATLNVRTSTQSHVAFGSDPDLLVQRLTADFTEGTSSSLSSSNATTYTNQPAATSTHDSTVDVSTSESVWVGVDVTDMIEDILPASVKKRNGTAGTGTGVFYGVRLRAVDEGSGSDVSEFYSDDTSSEPYIRVVYTTNNPPAAPVLSTPANGAQVSDTTPALVFSATDADGDNIVHYQIELSTNAAFTAPVAGYPALEGADPLNPGVGVASGAPITHTVPSALPAGVTYYWRVKVDDGSDESAYSATWSFFLNQAPTATKVSPLASQFAAIHNLSDLAIWTLAGAHAKPTLDWSYADPDGHAQSAYRVRIYDAAVAGALVHDSGKVLSTATVYNATLAMVLGTQRWWTIEVWDQYDLTSGESSRTGFKVKWGQAIYEHNPGAGSSSWQFSTGALAGGTLATLFRSATGTGGAGASAWATSVGALTPAAWLQVLVRLATSTVGTNPTLADATFTYLGASAQPDRWVFTPSSEWGLDADSRRFGSQGLKCSVVAATTGNRYVYPYRKTVGDDLPVVPGTTRTFSAYVKTNGVLAGGALRLYVYPGGTLADPIAGSAVGITDTSAYPDGWQRLTLTYDVPEGVTTVRPLVHYTRVSGVTESFWVDAAMDEEGTVASQWQPGFVGDPVVLDSNGVMVDGAAGGILRARGSTGGSRDTFELGPRGLLIGSDLELYSPSQGVLVPGDDTARATVLRIPGGPTGNEGGQVELLGAGANTDWAVDNSTGTLRFYAGASTVRAVLRDLAAGAGDALEVFGDFKAAGNVEGASLSITGGVDTAELATLAKRLRFVPIAQVDVVGAPSTATADLTAATSAEITSLPVNKAYALWGHLICRSSDTGSQAMSALHWDGNVAGSAYSGGVAARGGGNNFVAVLGGTNNRQLKYTVSWTSGTISYFIRANGYFTLED